MVVRLLVARGAPVNHQTDSIDGSPLFIAAMSGESDIARFLCANGADAYWESNSSAGAFWVAAQNGHVHVVEYLAEEIIRWDESTASMYSSALNEALSLGHVDAARVLLAHNAHFQSDEEMRSDLLCQTISYNKCDIVHLLMKHGADVNAPFSLDDIDGVDLVLTPLLVAAGCGDLELVKFLCENGADVEGVSDQDETTLLLATTWSKRDVVEYLLTEQNANALSMSSYGLAPAMTSFYGLHDPVFQCMITHGALRSTREALVQEVNDWL